MQEKRTRIIVEIGVAVALSAIFNLIPLWKMPQGGSVSLEMLPIFIIAFRWGGIPGITAGFIYGLLQLTMGAYIVHPLQVLMDYPVPYMLVGLAGFIRSEEHTSELQSRPHLVCRLLLEKKKT